MKKSLLLTVMILAWTLQAVAYKKESKQVTVKGKQRDMVVFTPKTMQEKMPLFIVTHGMNQDPEYQYGSDKMYEMIDTAKFVITYLRSNGNTWDCWGGDEDKTFVIKAIDEMARLYNIDTDRVYWTGFSMGSMLLHSQIGNMQDKIAAFAPTSGILQNSSPWNDCKKPVNLLEVIAYGDETFKYEEFKIHSYIENYAKHDKHTQYSKISGYKAKSSNWQDGDLEKWTGGPNGGEVWLYSYNNGGHWPSDQNRFLIWNFCKRFTLNQPTAKITEPAGETTYLYMAPKGEAEYPDITVTATAKANSGTIEKVDIYDGSKLIETLTAAPYKTTVTAPATGMHTLRAVATDSKGKTGEYSCLVNYATAATEGYNLMKAIKTEGIVPQNWYVSNGSVKRAGGGLAFTSGNRVLKFTNTTKAFEYGLLVQNATTKAKNAWAKFGDKNARTSLTLHAGQYALRFKACNWNCPKFAPITVAIETTDGQEVASKTITPTVNIGNNTANSFSTVAIETFTFDITDTGDYVIVFYTDAAKNSDFVLALANLQAKKFFTTGISDVKRNEAQGSKYVYDLSGRRLPTKKSVKPGLYIKDGRKVADR